MNKRLFSLLAVVLTAASGQAAVNDMLAYWSYDAATLTLANGNVTGVADLTGNHNATPGSGIGSASVANGGPTFTSNAIPTTNVVAGRFGDALTLTGFNTAAAGGGQFLMFPELTQIQASGGAPSFTISMWLKTTNTGFSGFAGLSQWGNSAGTPGRFAYGFGPSGTAQMRAQSRFDNATAIGGDIYARAAATATLNDNNWHMLTWTFDKGNGTLRSYFDGQLVDTFTSTATSFEMVNSSSGFGSLGLKGDSGTFINGSISWDEMYVFRGVADDTEIQSLFTMNAVPEPGSFGLLGCGALLLVRRRRRSAG